MIDKEDLAELQEIHRSLESERAPFEAEWKQIIQYIGLAYDKWPLEQTRKAGVQEAPKYLLTDSTGATASDTLANGVEGYACSSSLQWFDYGIEDIDEDADREMAGSLLKKVVRMAYQWLQKSNWYPQFRSFIRSGADLGTAGLYFAMDSKTGLPMFRTFELKDIVTMDDEYGRVDTLFRRFYLTKREAEKLFGKDELPRYIKECTDRRKKFAFINLISPVTKWDFTVSGSGDWISIYWAEDDKERTLREERLEEKPFAIFRWEEPVYGGSWGVDSPGQLALPAMRFVNMLMEDMITLSELTAKGHWKKTKGLKVNFTAGGVTELNAGEDFALQQATGDLAWLAEHIAYYRAVINECYKTNLFLTLTQNIDRTKTATEVAGLTQERETLMQSFWSRLATQVFEPVHEWLYLQILKSGKLVDITEEELEALRTLDMRIDYVSPAYMAQKRAFELGPSLQWISDMMQLAQINPNLLDKINFDTFADMDANVRNADMSIVIKTEDAQKARQIRAQLEAQATQNQLQQEALDNQANAYSKMTKAPEEGSAAAMLMGAGGQQGGSNG